MMKKIYLHIIILLIQFEGITQNNWNTLNPFTVENVRLLEQTDVWKQASFGTPDTLVMDSFMGGNGMIPLLDIAPMEGKSCWGIVNQYEHGNKKEYIGITFAEPLEYGATYTINLFIYKHEKTPVINLALFGTDTENALPFGEELSMEDPTFYNKYFEILGKVKYTDTSDWKKVNISFTANKNYKTLVLGPDEEKSPFGANMKTYNYYYLDAISLIKTNESNKLLIETSGHFCTKNLALSIPYFDDATYQWYKNNIKIKKANQNTYIPKKGEEGIFRVEEIHGNQIKISNDYHITAPIVTMEVAWQDISKENSEGKIFLTNIIAEEPYTILVNNQKTLESTLENLRFGKYEIILKDKDECVYQTTVNIGSQANSKELVILSIPNIITPNNDGYNDIFFIEAKNMESYKVDIFTKGGAFIHSFTEKENQWDGQNTRTQLVDNGSYYYVLTAKGSDQKEYIHKGFVEVIK